MNERDEERMKKLLQQALPPVKVDAEPDGDLWPAMLRRLDEKPAAPPRIRWAWMNELWFDGALLAGLIGLAAFFPASIPLLLYYL
ncbi:MAG: hypothetical protein ABSF70_01510 [Terracidiphilus sp.]|jgi:hypothetical protein